MKSSLVFKGRRKKATFGMKIVDHRAGRMKIRRATRDLSKQDNRDEFQLRDDNEEQQDERGIDQGWDEVEGDQHIDHTNTGHSAGEYKLRRKKRAEAWAKVRCSIVCSVVESEAHVSNNKFICVSCRDNSACVRCPDCGGNGLYCVPCAEKFHCNINITHTPLIWKAAENRFVPMELLRSLRYPHECTGSEYFRDLICSDILGLKSVRVYFCNCFSEMEILTYLQLFPATPQNPQLVFTFKLLDWLEALFLECQVAVQDMVTALHLIYQQTKSSTTCALYPVIIDSFEEYRYLKHQLQSMKFVLENRENDGTKCPACYMNKTPTLAIDANFGLCRKVAAGTSDHDPLHLSTGFLCEQQSVDHFVSTYGQTVEGNKEECNQFLASSALRSNTRYKSLDETGLVSVVCKHEFPVMFYSLKHGERLSYIVYALEELKKRNHQWTSCRFLYDVSCSLVRHLKKRQRLDILSCFKFAVPVFHSYGHKVNCQLRYNPRNLKGFGMADGECCERLWSYLRRFSRSTKECRPSHRVDMLSDALLYYGRMSADQLETLLPNRFRRYNEVLLESKRELETLIKSSPVAFDISDIDQWYNTEVHAESCVSDHVTSWEEEYFKLLDSYYTLKNQIGQAASLHTVATVSTHLLQMENKLSQMEHIHGILSRPIPDSTEYKNLKYRVSIGYLDQLKIKIALLARERWFFLILKAKFADGQCISSRLSKSITATSTKLKKLLSEYNSYNIYSLKWEDVTNLSSHVWYEGVLCNDDQGIPSSIKLKAIELYNTMVRCEEEISYLRDDMIQTVAFYVNDLLTLSQKIAQLQSESSPPTQYHQGCLILLHSSCFELEARIIDLYHSFSEIANITLPCNIFRYHSFSSQPSRLDHATAVPSPIIATLSPQLKHSTTIITSPISSAGCANTLVNTSHFDQPSLPQSEHPIAIATCITSPTPSVRCANTLVNSSHDQPSLLPLEHPTATVITSPVPTARFANTLVSTSHFDHQPHSEHPIATCITSPTPSGRCANTLVNSGHDQPLLSPLEHPNATVITSSIPTARCANTLVNTSTLSGRPSLPPLEHPTVTHITSTPSTRCANTTVNTSTHLDSNISNMSKNDQIINKHEEVSSESEDEDFEQINWRKQRLERNEYLQGLNNYMYLDLSDDLSVEYKDLLSDL